MSVINKFSNNCSNSNSTKDQIKHLMNLTSFIDKIRKSFNLVQILLNYPQLLMQTNKIAVYFCNHEWMDPLVCVPVSACGNDGNHLKKLFMRSDRCDSNNLNNLTLQQRSPHYWRFILKLALVLQENTFIKRQQQQMIFTKAYNVCCSLPLSFTLLLAFWVFRTVLLLVSLACCHVRFVYIEVDRYSFQQRRRTLCCKSSNILACFVALC